MRTKKIVCQRLVKKKLGRKKKLSPQKTQAIKCAVVKDSKLTASKIQEKYKVQLSVRQIQRMIRSFGGMYIKDDEQILLDEGHRIKRKEFALHQAGWKDEWNFIVFMDEKTFNLDGPDGPSFHWYIPEESSKLLTKTTHTKGSVKVWGSFYSGGVFDLVRYFDYIDSEAYQAFFNPSLLRKYRTIVGSDYEFQQDNASFHVSNSTVMFFRSRNVKLIPWPALSPDINPIENIWGIITQKVYFKNGYRINYISADLLYEAIKTVWYNLADETLQNLVNSLPLRMEKRIKSDGEKIPY